MVFDRLEDNRVRCYACAFTCNIPPGRTGICRVRENQDGTLYLITYGMVSSVNVDPIEKKPLYHFYPGSDVLSLGSVSCNFRCLQCQNYTIAQVEPGEIPTEYIGPREAVDIALDYGADGIAWTYNEPAIWYEYTYDSARIAHDEGLYTVYVTNGYMTERGLRKLAPHLDAANVDVKSFTEEFYHDICSARLQPVLDTCRLMRELGVHLELTYLVLPGENDDPEEIREFAKWVHDELGPDTPLHFSRFHPAYKLTEKPSTPIKTIERAHDIAREEDIRYVYAGNVPGHQYDNTYCPWDDTLLIKRSGFDVTEINLQDSHCPTCGRHLNITRSST